MSWKLLLAASLLVPFALAHTPAGTPKNYCEPLPEWDTHDYTGASGAGDLSVRGPLYDGNILGDCNGNGVLFDFDYHHEWGPGWARLDVVNGDGATFGSIACHGTFGHHPQFGPITAEDVVFGQTVRFIVMADTTSLVPPTDPSQPNCGDGQITPCSDSPCLGGDGFAEFVGTGSPTFPAGLDGSYLVVVVDLAVAGHISS